MRKILLYGKSANEYVRTDLTDAEGAFICPDYVERFKSIDSNFGAVICCYRITKRINLYILCHVFFDNHGNIKYGNIVMVSTNKNECLNECRRYHLQSKAWFKAHYGDRAMSPEEV